MEEKGAAKVEALLKRVTRLSSQKPSVRGSPKKGLSAQQINQKRAQVLDSVRHDLTLARAALDRLRRPRVDPIAVDAAGRQVAQPPGPAERKDQKEERGEEKRVADHAADGGDSSTNDGDDDDDSDDDSSDDEEDDDDDEHSNRPRRPRA